MANEIIILIGLLILSAFFSGSETALFSISKLKARHLVDQKRRGAKTLLQLQEDPRFTLITILVFNNLINILASAIATSVAIGYFENNAVGIATGVMTFLILTFGEIVPKSIATAFAQPIALVIARPIRILGIIILPIVKLFDFLMIAIFKLFGSEKKMPLVTEEEIKSFVKVGEQEGTIDEMEKKLIDNIFKFDDINASEIMTPRTDMDVVKVDKLLKDVYKSLLKSTHSRFPVIEKSKDHVIGVLHIKDVMKSMQFSKSSKRVRDVMRKPYFIPVTKKIDNLLRQFQRRKEHMAIVMDEYGGVAGIITLENVLEEIVGEIVDETDKVKPNIRKVGRKEWIILAKSDIEEVNDKLNTKLEIKEKYDTLGGYILNKLGRIPKVGDKLTAGKFTLQISKVEDKRIIDVKLTKK